MTGWLNKTAKEIIKMADKTADTPKKPWWQQKTTWAAVTGIIGAIAGAATGEMTVVAAAQTILGCVVAIFLRQSTN